MSIVLDGTSGLAGAATGALNGTLGATTPSTVVATTGTFSSTVTVASFNGATVGNGGGGVSSNVAIGSGALASNTSGSQNVAIGTNAFATATTSDNNVAIGRASLNLATGSYNTAVGAYNCGSAITTGSNNSILGGYTGNGGGLDIRTSNNNVVLSSGDTSIAARWALGGGWYQYNNSASWSTTSDLRIKENVIPLSNGLGIITALRPVEFDYILNKQHEIGFIAQEYEQVLPAQILEDANITDELKALTNGEPVKGIQQNLVPYLVSAIQELNAKFEAYKASHP